MTPRRLTVEAWRAESLATTKYDALVATLGFEERAWFVPSIVGPNSLLRFACGFEARREHSYSRNEQRFRDGGFAIAEPSDEVFGQWWSKTLDDVAIREPGRPLRMCVDISSMTRARLAHIVRGLTLLDGSQSVTVDLVYAIATYSPPSDVSPIEICAPVTPDLAGWWSEPERPAIAIFGLGYEEERAVGAWEYIEPTRVWAFCPTGEDERYDSALAKANQSLWDVLPPSNVVRYRVDDPFETFSTLEGLVFGTRASSRVILVPFGPKMFAMCAILVASIHWPFVAVWRVSSGQGEPPLNRYASGKIVGIRVTLDSGDESSPIID